MHELSVTEGILNTALNEAQDRKVKKIIQINLVVGSLSGIVPECVQEYFNLLSEDTVAAGAVLNFVMLPAMLECRDCTEKFKMEHLKLQCPVCGSRRVDIVQGKEFFLDSMEVEED